MINLTTLPSSACSVRAAASEAVVTLNGQRSRLEIEICSFPHDVKSLSKQKRTNRYISSHLRNKLPVNTVGKTIHSGPQVSCSHNIVQVQLLIGVKLEWFRAALGPGPERGPAGGLLVRREVVEELLDLVGVLSLPVKPGPGDAVFEFERAFVYCVLECFTSLCYSWKYNTKLPKIKAVWRVLGGAYSAVDDDRLMIMTLRRWNVIYIISNIIVVLFQIKLRIWTCNWTVGGLNM